MGYTLNTTKTIRLILAAAALPALSSWTGCGGDPSRPSEPSGAPAISIYTTVIPESDDLYLYDRGGTAYTIAWRFNDPGIGYGSIIVGPGDGGYIRRVISCRADNNLYILETEDASLTDAVVSGLIEAVFEPDDLTSGRLELSETPLYPPGGDTGQPGLAISHGYIDFDPTTRVGLLISRKEPHSIDMEVDGRLEFSLELAADFPGPFEYSGEAMIASFSRTTTAFIGCVPVVIELVHEIRAGVSIEGEYADICSAGCYGSAPVSVDCSYRNGSWTHRRSADPVLEPIPLECATYSDGAVDVSVSIAVKVLFYSGNGFTLRIEPWTRVSSETIYPPYWAWELSGGIRDMVEFDPAMISEEAPPFSSGVFDSGRPLDSGPYSTDCYIFVTAWGSEGYGEPQLSYPRGMAVGNGGRLYVCDNMNHRVQVFSPDSTLLDSWGGFGTSAGSFNLPADAAVDAYGDVYIVDRGNNRIQKFTAEGDYLTGWGGEGTGPGEFRAAEGVAAAPDGRLYVVDSYRADIQVFSSDGILLDSWGEEGVSPGQLSGPMGIAADADGYIYISECYSHRVQKFTAGGEYMTHWGSQGIGSGSFDCPVAIAAGPGGRIFVCDYGNDRVEIFDSSGLYISTLGSSGSGEGEFDSPAGVALDPGGDLFISDSRNHRIQRFAPLP